MGRYLDVLIALLMSIGVCSSAMYGMQSERLSVFAQGDAAKEHFDNALKQTGWNEGRPKALSLYGK